MLGRKIKGRECWQKFSSVQLLSHVRLSVTPWTVEARLHYPPSTPRACSSSSPLSWWCHPITSSSVVPFYSCLQSFPASGSFLKSQFFASGCQSISVSASALVLPMNIQDWFPLGLTGLISLWSKGLSFRIDWYDLLAVQENPMNSMKRSTEY